MEYSIYETGGFGGQMLIGAFDPKPESFHHTKQYFGMPQNQHHLYVNIHQLNIYNVTVNRINYLRLRVIVGVQPGYKWLNH